MGEWEDIVKEREKLEDEIAQFPVGYISKKNIHGKIRYYRQWTENGKIKSQYIKEEELDEILEPTHMTEPGISAKELLKKRNAEKL